MNATKRRLSTKDRFTPTECSVCHKLYAKEIVIRHWQQMSNNETNRGITKIHDLNIKRKYWVLDMEGKSSTTTSSNNKNTANTDSDITINTGDIHHDSNDNKDSNIDSNMSDNNNENNNENSDYSEHESDEKLDILDIVPTAAGIRATTDLILKINQKKSKSTQTTLEQTCIM